MDTRLIDAAEVVIQMLEEKHPRLAGGGDHNGRLSLALEAPTADIDFSSDELHQAIRFLIRIGYFDSFEFLRRDRRRS